MQTNFVQLLIFILPIFTFAPCWAQVSLEARNRKALESDLYRYIDASQIRDGSRGRINGEWRIYSNLNGSYFGDEADSFLTAQELVILTEVNEHVHLPGFAQIEKLAGENLQTYIDDATHLREAPGTIAYFPVIDPATGRRGLQNVPITQLVSSFDVPGDLDSSSALALWYEASGRGVAYLNSFANSIGRYRDVQRTVEHAHDRLWKPANTGAFLTWAEADQVRNPQSRIFEGVNDVDCVVNLNVLAAASHYRQTHSLPAATENGVQQSCQLINQTVAAGRTANCALWYDRSSQFWYSYSRAYALGASCLAPSLAKAKTDLIAEASAIDREPISSRANRVTQTAEVVIAMKRLIAPADRDKEVSTVINDLEVQLAALTTINGQHAIPASEDSLYLARGFGMRLDWYSPSYSAAIELLAMALP